MVFADYWERRFNRLLMKRQPWRRYQPAQRPIVKRIVSDAIPREVLEPLQDETKKKEKSWRYTITNEKRQKKWLVKLPGDVRRESYFFFLTSNQSNMEEAASCKG